MASIEKRERKDGTTAFRVIWRDPDTRKKDALTFDDEKQAERLQKLLDANGQRLIDAQRVAQAIVNNVPTIADVVEHHIEHLTGVTARTKRDYRRDARNHITPHGAAEGLWGLSGERCIWSGTPSSARRKDLPWTTVSRPCRLGSINNSLRSNSSILPVKTGWSWLARTGG